MNSDSKASQSSVLQGPPSGRLNSDQNFDFAADNFGISEVDQNVEHHSFTAERLEEHDLFQQLASEGQTVPDIRPAVRSFRARWKAQSQARLETLSNKEDEASESQPDSQSLGVWEDGATSSKRPRVHESHHVNAQVAHEDIEPLQLQNVARLASLEAMQRFRSHDIKMPWEKGPLAPVFGAPLPSMTSAKTLMPPMVGLVDTLAPVALTKQETPIPVGPISKFAVKRIASARCVVPEDEMLARCLNQIKNLILMDLQGTEVGVTLCNLAGGLDESADVLQILRDCFARKATATVLKRTSALWALAGWMIQNEQTTVWAMSEKQLYDYMCFLREQHAAPTRASHLVESLNFFDSALRFRKMVCKTLLSSRVLGAAHSMYLEKRKLKQAPQLTVSAVKALEIICISNTSLLRTAVAGALLFCVFASARWSDFSRLENIWTDRCGDLVLVEAETSKHKTSRSKEAKTRLLPFTALGRFACDEVWGECFVQALNEIKGNTGLTFLPSWNDRSGTWAISPMTTAEASLFLKEFLETVLGEEEAAKYSSHSCKPTVLTWCGMTEILTREERTMLGHHIEPSTKSATTYNRDSQLLLQAKVAKVLDKVLQGHLDPDASRATRLNQLLQVGEPEQDEESAESDFEDTEVASIHSKCHLVERPSVPLGDADEYNFVAHKLTGTIHVVQDEDAGRLACGRRKTINMNQVEPDSIDSATAPFCIQCNAVVKPQHA